MKGSCGKYLRPEENRYLGAKPLELIKHLLDR